MRRPTISVTLSTLLALSAYAMSASALEVKFCVPSCAADASPAIRGPGTPTTASGVTTTTVSIPSFVKGPFTISGTVTSQQSGTLQKITFNPTAITASATGGCNATATNPCRLEVVATSSTADFPAPKPTGGYPAGVFMAGYFTGAQPVHKSPPDPNGDTISMTGESSGLSASGSPLNNAVINATPGTSVGDTPVSLPASCTGSPSCKFIATSAIKSFNTQIQETVQQVCDGTSSCLTRLRTTVNVDIKTPGNRVNLPGGTISVTPPAPDEPPRDLTEILIAETLSPLGDVSVGQLLVWPNDFALMATLKLDANRSISPDQEETYVRIGAFAMSIPAGEFRRLLNGRLYTFVGRLNGLDVAAALTRDRRNPSQWLFTLGVHGVRLSVPAAPAQVQVDIAVGSDTGSDLVLAKVY